MTNPERAKSGSLTVGEIRVLERAYFDGDPRALADVEPIIRELAEWADAEEGDE